MKEFSPAYRTEFTSGHINFTFFNWYIRTFRPRTYVEIGVYQGDTFYAAAETLEKEQIKSVAIGIDPWESPGEPQFEESDKKAYKLVHDELDRCRSFYKHCQIRTIRARSVDLPAIAPFADISEVLDGIDLLFIDGNHEFASVKDDFETYYTLMRKNGVILFHDTFWKGKYGGPGQFLRELSQTHPVLNFYHDRGLGVLFMPEAFSKIPLVDKFKTDWAVYLASKVKA